MIFSRPHLRDGARWRNMRVGLLGGSFHPPHAGHIHASLAAIKCLKLDVVWWLVTPQNPLKSKTTTSFEDRFDLCESFVNHPQIIVSDIERQLKLNLTWQTIRALRHYFPQTDFVWVTGMDNALSMHKWHRWRDILDHVATAHVARPPAWSLIEQKPLKMLSHQKHRVIERSGNYPLLPHHTYWIMQNKLLNISSTDIRTQDEKSID